MRHELAHFAGPPCEETFTVSLDGAGGVLASLAAWVASVEPARLPPARATKRRLLMLFNGSLRFEHQLLSIQEDVHRLFGTIDECRRLFGNQAVMRGVNHGQNHLWFGSPQSDELFADA